MFLILCIRRRRRARSLLPTPSTFLFYHAKRGRKKCCKWNGVEYNTASVGYNRIEVTRWAVISPLVDHMVLNGGHSDVPSAALLSLV